MRLFVAFFAILVIDVVDISNAEFVEVNRSPFFREHKYESAISTKQATEKLRGRKQFDSEEDGFFENFGFKKGQYKFGEREYTGFTDIRINVPGEPGIDYPVYFEIPRTSFSCIGRHQGYYADEEAGCQLFHVCDADDQILSFLCPVGSLFSQRLLTCDWWTKVPCSQSSQFHDRQSNDINKIPLKVNNHVESGTIENSKKYFSQVEHDRVVSTNNEPGKETKPHNNNSNNVVNKIAILPKNENYSRLNESSNSRDELNKEQPNRDSVVTNSTSILDEQLNTILQGHDNSVKHTEDRKNQFRPVVIDDAKQQNINPLTKVEKTENHSFYFEPVPTEATAVSSATAGNDDDMEGIESIGLVNAHSERNTDALADNIFVGEIDDAIGKIMIIFKDLENKKPLNTLTTGKNDTTQKSIMEDINRPAQALPNRIVKPYKTQNIHNLSGFIINSPIKSNSNAMNDLQHQQNSSNSRVFQSNGMNQQIEQKNSNSVDEEKIDSSPNRPSNNYQQEIHNSNIDQSKASAGAIIQKSPDQNFKTAVYVASNHDSKDMETTGENEEKDQILANDDKLHKQESDFQQYTVNYHTHYFPDTFLKYLNNQKLITDSNTKAIHKINEETNKNRKISRANYYNNVESEDDVQFKDFGVRIVKEMKKQDNERLPKTVKQTEDISENAQRINSGLQQQGKPAAVNLLWTMFQAFPNVTNPLLPRPFMKKYTDYSLNDPNFGSPANNHPHQNRRQKEEQEREEKTDKSSNVETSSTEYVYPSRSLETFTNKQKSSATYTVQSSTPSANDNSNDGKYIQNLGDSNDGKTITVETEFIPSFGFDFSNDQEKRKYYENFQQDVSAQEVIENVNNPTK